MQTLDELGGMKGGRARFYRDRLFDPEESGRRVKLTCAVAYFALLPMLVISVAAQHYASIFNGLIPIELTNFKATLSMFANAYHMRDHGDSWVPMLAALRTLHGSTGEEIYRTLFLAYGVPLGQASSGAVSSDGGESLYKTLFFAYGIRFQYPPTSLLSLDFLSMFGFPGRTELSGLNFAVYCINALGCGWLGWVFFRSRQSNETQPAYTVPDPLGIAILTFVSAFLFYPLVRATVLGQIQVWIDALFTCALICWTYDRRFCAGIFIGLACSIKPQLGLLLLWAVLWRQFAFSSGILVAVIPLTVVSLLRYGLQNHLAYLDVLSFLGRHGEIYFPNNSVNGILNAYFSGRNNMAFDLPGLLPDIAAVRWGTLAASVVFLGLLVVPPLLRRRENPSVADFGAAAICTVVGSPVAWEHHYGILFPLYLLALRMAFGISEPVRRFTALGAVMISWTLVANFIPFAHLLAQTPLRIVQAHCSLGALVLLVLLFSFHGRGEIRETKLSYQG